MAEPASRVEQIIRYLRARAGEIEALEFGRISFDLHHGKLRRANISRTDEFSNEAEERVGV